MATKARITKAERALKERTKNEKTFNPEHLRIRIVNYRAGLSPEVKESADAIPVRWVNMANTGGEL
jgi:hypothetical protein